jgi:hypothetical protein
VRSSDPLPPSSERNLRRLSRSAGGAERPLRAQVVLGSMLGLILIAIPLYLLRRPSGTPGSSLPDAGVFGFGGVFRDEADASSPVHQVLLGSIQRVKCGPSPAQISNEGELCDELPALEAALRQSILGAVECAPRTGKEGSINFVLEVDFESSRYNLFPGKSGKWRGPQARRAIQCVLRGFPPVDLSTVSHQFGYYAIAILAVYPPPDPFEILPTFDDVPREDVTRDDAPRDDVPRDEVPRDDAPH